MHVTFKLILFTLNPYHLLILFLLNLAKIHVFYHTCIPSPLPLFVFFMQNISLFSLGLSLSLSLYLTLQLHALSILWHFFVLHLFMADSIVIPFIIIFVVSIAFNPVFLPYRWAVLVQRIKNISMMGYLFLFLF